MFDFTIKIYNNFLISLKALDLNFTCFSNLISFKIEQRTILLRHDVDLLPQNSLKFARIQNELGIVGTYYFRAVPESWDEKIIKEIHDLGHEIGYHYESLTTCNGNMEAAIKDFDVNLAKLRKLVPVSTICMHGSPRSPWDSKDLWKKYNYKDFDIIGEPYFDIDFSKVLYLTDTGRRWDGDKVSVRDKIKIDATKLNLASKYNFRHTSDIIKAAKDDKLPDKIMFTFHPQRWTNKAIPWVKELIWQNLKNIVKKYYYVK